MTDYRCVNGHDKCGEMYAGPECPYCAADVEGVQQDFLTGLFGGPAVLAASERGSAWLDELLAAGLVETFRAGPIVGADADGVKLLCVRLTEAGRRRMNGVLWEGV